VVPVPLAAVLFDFDGTLLDTESVALQSWREEYDHHGAPFDEAGWLAEVGTETDRYGVLAGVVGPVFDADASRGRRRARELHLIRGVEPHADVDAALTALTAAGVRLAVVSSSPATWVHPNLERLGWLARFEFVVTREDAPRAKPQPDLYLRALQLLNANPAVAVAVEDSATGVRAARAAWLRCVAMPNPVTEHQDFAYATALTTCADLLRVLSALGEATAPV
jgi:HAD superfamily hydrolase (TIGR01509 family)